MVRLGDLQNLTDRDQRQWSGKVLHDVGGGTVSRHLFEQFVDDLLGAQPHAFDLSRGEALRHKAAQAAAGRGVHQIDRLGLDDRLGCHAREVTAGDSMTAETPVRGHRTHVVIAGDEPRRALAEGQPDPGDGSLVHELSEHRIELEGLGEVEWALTRFGAGGHADLQVSGTYCCSGPDSRTPPAARTCPIRPHAPSSSSVPLRAQGRSRQPAFQRRAGAPTRVSASHEKWPGPVARVLTPAATFLDH